MNTIRSLKRGITTALIAVIMATGVAAQDLETKVSADFKSDGIESVTRTRVGVSGNDLGIALKTYSSQDGEESKDVQNVEIATGPILIYARHIQETDADGTSEKTQFGSLYSGKHGPISVCGGSLVHFDPGMTGTTTYAKLGTDVAGINVELTGDFEHREHDANSGAMYLDAAGSRIGAGLGFDYDRDVRADLGWKTTAAGADIGGLHDFNYETQTDDWKSINIVAQNPGAVTSPKGAGIAGDVFVIGEFEVDKTYLSNDGFKCAGEGLLGRFDVASNTGVMTFSPSIGYNAGNGLAGSTGFDISDGEMEGFAKIGYRTGGFFVEGCFTEDSQAIYVSFSK